jgi:hypothetical protein
MKICGKPSRIRTTEEYSKHQYLRVEGTEPRDRASRIFALCRRTSLSKITIALTDRPLRQSDRQCSPRFRVTSCYGAHNGPNRAQPPVSWKTRFLRTCEKVSVKVFTSPPRIIRSFQSHLFYLDSLFSLLGTGKSLISFNMTERTGNAESAW